MIKTLKISAMLIALVAAMIGIFAFTASDTQAGPATSISEKSIANNNAVSVESNSMIDARYAGRQGAVNSNTTAYQDHVARTDAGKLQKRIALGFTKENPFYKYRNFGYASAIRFGIDTVSNFDQSFQFAERKIYDLPPNLRAHCTKQPFTNFHSPALAYRFRQDRSRFV